LRFFLGRYETVWNDHGFMVGVDYVVTLPLQWLVISAYLVAAGFVTAGRWKLASWMALALVIRIGGPAAVRATYVQPNEISIERPYIQQHIQATRSTFGLDGRLTETEVATKLDGRFDPGKKAGAAPECAALGLARLPRYSHADSGAASLLHICITHLPIRTSTAT
jgi:uncharacterized protein